MCFLLRILRCCCGSTLGTEQCLSEINITQTEQDVGGLKREREDRTEKQKKKEECFNKRQRTK